MPKIATKTEPEIVAEIDSGLKELALLSAKRKQVDGRLETECTAIRSRYQKLLVCEDGTSFDEREQSLQQSIGELCEQHRSLLLGDEKKKSRELTHGKFGWRQRPLSIEVSEASDSTWQRCLQRVLDAAMKAIAAIKSPFKSILASGLVKVSVSSDKAAIKKALNENKVTLDQLKDSGLSVKGGEDELFIEPVSLVLTGAETTS